ncbi:Xanthine permease XanQ [Oligella ureolytica]|uniref:Purine permease n=1 Tax=Oligella ureolytica TaxID=90244 RepID=A0A378XFN2_9BURK|nr:nucleobase:cation symporter-2 family protein [Oligella ureolytica]QPT39258.1 purine permease [Oligella ureolytica]SUA55440.1 Xanthine permease XanQ [Oligella ureolytica]SUA56683.1 Xanthine permease XanQ [Oligella ureolytica]
MSHTQLHEEPTNLVYKLEDKPPFFSALLSAMTHLLAIFVPMITPALIVGGALQLPVEMTAYLVSMAMIASGVGTYIQVNRFGFIGSGLLSIQSVNFSFVTVMIGLGMGMKEDGFSENAMISALLGVSFVGAFLIMGAAWILPYLKRVITPTVSGVVVMMIGLSLIHVGIVDFGGGFASKADGTFGSWSNLGLATLVLVIILVFNCFKNPLLRMGGIAIGLVVGYIVALFMGKVDFSALHNLPIITVPVLFKYGFDFQWHAFFIAGTIYLLSVFEAVGDLTATALVSNQPIKGETFDKRLRGGVMADGLVSVIATALGSLPLTTFAQNNGVIQMTGVASRHIGKYIAVILIILGLFPMVGRFFTTIPSPVLGGAMVLMFGLITIAGIRIILTNGIRRREAIICATSVGLGLGVAFEPEIFNQLPLLFQNPICMGGITAVVLNLILPQDEQEQVVYIEDNLEI